MKRGFVIDRKEHCYTDLPLPLTGICPPLSSWLAESQTRCWRNCSNISWCFRTRHETHQGDQLSRRIVIGASLRCIGGCSLRFLCLISVIIIMAIFKAVETYFTKARLWSEGHVLVLIVGIRRKCTLLSFSLLLCSGQRSSTGDGKIGYGFSLLKPR